MTNKQKIIMGMSFGFVSAYLVFAFVLWDFLWMPDASQSSRVLFIGVFLFSGLVGAAFSLLEDEE